MMNEARPTIGEQHAANAPDTVQTRAARGAALLLVRVVLLRFLTLGSSIILARLLLPADYGVYAIVSSIVAFLTTFSDVGLGATLIQQREAPTEAELATTFTIQLVMVSLAAALGVGLAYPLSAAFGLATSGEWLVRVIIISLPLSLLRTIPALLLERQLAYGRLSIIEIGEILAFHLTAVIFALSGAGVWSFIWATLARAIVGLITAQIVSPWTPRLGFSQVIMWQMLRFGLPYQLQSTFIFTKDSLTAPVLALLVGTAAVGYINWALTLAMIPALITSIVARVTFPAFARAQDDLILLRRMVERSIRLSAIIFLPISCLLIGAGEPLIRLVYTEKWLPALPAFILFSFSLWPGQIIGTSFFSVFYAAGRSRWSLYFTILYGVLDWGIGIPLVLFLGFEGIAIRAVIVAYATLPLSIWVVRRIIPITIFPQIIRPLSVAISCGLVQFGALHVAMVGPVALAAITGATLLLYAAIIAALEREILAATLSSVLPINFQRLGVIRWYCAA